MRTLQLSMACKMGPLEYIVRKSIPAEGIARAKALGRGMSGVFKKQKSSWPEQHGERAGIGGVFKEKL